MLPEPIRQTILALHEQGTALREISRRLGLSRNAVRRALHRPERKRALTTELDPERLELIRSAFARARGNAVRTQELLQADYGLELAYSTLTRYLREAGLRPRPQRAGAYTFAPGQEMPHDTTVHRLVLGERPLSAQCASLVLAYSRRLFIRYYPRFTRFEAKAFLAEALEFMQGACPVCEIDNTSVIVIAGSGAEAEIAPEMRAFGAAFGLRFAPHRLGHADRKARVERPFRYVEGNFLPGRVFRDWADLNRQALDGCQSVANAKPKRALGMRPEAAYVLEKPHLLGLPAQRPPIYHTHARVVDVEGFVCLETNRYSVPERLIGQTVTLYQYPDRLQVFFRHERVAEHRPLIGQRQGKLTAPGHHAPLARQRAYRGPSLEEQQLTGHSERLDRYVTELKRRSHGRGVVRLRRLLQLKQCYPTTAFDAALGQALHYGLYDLNRLEQLILERVAGDFFQLGDEP